MASQSKSKLKRGLTSGASEMIAMSSPLVDFILVVIDGKALLDPQIKDLSSLGNT